MTAAIFTAGEMAELREMAIEAQPDTCTIERVASRASDGQGGLIDTWAALSTGVTCRIRALNATGPEAVIAERLTGAEAWAVILPNGQDVTIKDRILVTSVTPNRRFEVQAIPGNDSFQAQLVTACVELLPS